MEQDFALKNLSFGSVQQRQQGSYFGWQMSWKKKGFIVLPNK
jgi:hypothetical protein